MNWEAIGAAGEVLGALAVILTLLYLSAQIRGSQVALRATQRESALDSVRQWNHRIMSDRDLADVVRRGIKSYEDLEPTEQVMFGHCFYSFFKASEDIYLRALTGEAPSDVWSAHEAAFLLYARQPGVREWLRRSESLLDMRFLEELPSGGGDPGEASDGDGSESPGS